MNAKDFLRLGVPLGEATRRATDFVAQYVLRGGDTAKLEDEIKAIVANPTLFAEDPLRKAFAKAIANSPPPPRAAFPVVAVSRERTAVPGIRNPRRRTPAASRPTEKAAVLQRHPDA